MLRKGHSFSSSQTARSPQQPAWPEMSSALLWSLLLPGQSTAHQGRALHANSHQSNHPGIPLNSSTPDRQTDRQGLSGRSELQSHSLSVMCISAVSHQGKRAEHRLQTHHAQETTILPYSVFFHCHSELHL